MKITMNISRTPEVLAVMCGGTLYRRGDAPSPAVTGICTDSREVDAETLFCAIRGERVDGHAFLPATIRQGCPVLLCERLPEGWDDLSSDSPLGACPAVALVVTDTVAALAHLAGSRREDDLRYLYTIAVTGSVGKTTTKEMIAAVLAAGTREKGSFFKKDGNFNSTIGLPLSMMEIPADTTHAVLEMGMSGRGEIAAMTAAARPDIAVIANIGSSHLELLGTRENIAAAKLEIAEGLRPGGTLILNGDEPLLDLVTEENLPVPTHILRLTLADASNADLSVHAVRSDARGMTFDLDTPTGLLRDLFIPAQGEHMVWAGAYAAAVGMLCGFSADSIREGLAAYRPASLRQSRRTVGEMTFLEDCYNAAPESMHAAFDVLDITAAHAPLPRRRIAVLGTMLELGDATVERHREVGCEFARRCPDLLFTVGALGAYIAEGARLGGLPATQIFALGTDLEPGMTDAYPAFAEAISAQLQPGDILLFKASRGMRLEMLSASLAERLQINES